MTIPYYKGNNGKSRDDEHIKHHNDLADAVNIGVSATDVSLSTTDVATNDVTSSKHGFAPKAPADATKFLNGAATPAYAQPKDSDLATTDITTNNASTSKHGFLRKLDNTASHYLDGTGAWSTPAGGGSVLDLVGTYGVSTSASAAANTTAMTSAFADAAALAVTGVGASMYLRGAGKPYPVNTLTLPSEPVTLYGDGPTASVFSTTSGTLLTYSNTTAALSGTSDNWSINSTSLGGAGAAVHYRSITWNIANLGFTKSDNWSGNSGTGLDFPVNASGGYVPMMFMFDCLITNFNGTGLNYLINGLRGESKFLRVVVDGCKNEGVIYGSDQAWVQCSSNNNGYEGFWADGRNGQLLGCKAYNNGVLNYTSRNAGFYYTNNSGGALFSNCYAQDNRGPGMQLHNAHLVSVSGLVADRNCHLDDVTPDTNAQAGVLMEDCTDCSIDGLVATDSNGSAKANIQKHALRVTNTSGTTCHGNRVRLVQYQTVQTITDPVDTGSDLLGTDVTVSGSSGGEVTLAFASGGMTPDGYKARTQVVGALTANMTGTIAVPTYSHKGQRMAFKFTQDGTGGRTLSWAAGYKQSFSATGNTANKITIAEFEYDGTNWVQVGTNVWV